MRKLLSILFALLLYGLSPFAQSKSVDSLKQLINTEPNSAKKLAILEELTIEASNSDFNQAKLYAIQGVTLADKVGNKQWQPKFYEMLGRIYANLLDLDSASYLFSKALNGYESVKNAEGQATTYFKIGWVYKRKGELEKAMEVDLKALKLMEKLGNKGGIADAMNRISEDLSRQERFDEAQKYAINSIAFSKQYNLGEALAVAYKSEGDVEIALERYNSAYNYYDSALQKLKSINASIFSILNVKNDRANAIKRMGKYKEALTQYAECLEMAEKVNYENQIYVSYANLGETNMLLGNYRKALPYALKTVAIQEKNQDVSNLTEDYGHVSTIYEKLGNYKNALKYERMARLMRDSTAKEESDKVMSEMLTRFETEKKDKTIANQKSTISQQKRTQTLYIVLASLLAFILFGLIYYNRKRQIKNRMLTSLNLKLDIKNHQNELLLKEIHHRVKNNLELVKSLLALQSAQLNDKVSKDAMLASQNRVQSMGIIHQKLYQGENPGSIEMKDYFINLSEGILDSFNADDKIKIDCAMEKLDLDVDTAIPIGLIVNELLTNALKYAFPNYRNGNISISLMKTSSEILTLKVADNGIGKVAGLQPHGTGFGSQLIQLLTKQLNGKMMEKIDKGTLVEFHFNLKTAA